MAYIKFFEKSDLTNSTAQIICHQVNCQGKMGSGVALAIRNKFPNVYNEYIFKHNNDGTKLGNLQIVEINSNCRNTKEHSQFVANIAGQFNYGYDGKRYTSYDALVTAFEKLSQYCIENNITSIALPDKFGCVRGGADWDIVTLILKKTFEKNTNLTIEIHSF